MSSLAGALLFKADPGKGVPRVSFFLVGNTVRHLQTDSLVPADIALAVGKAVLKYLKGGSSVKDPKLLLGSNVLQFERPAFARKEHASVSWQMMGKKVVLWDPSSLYQLSAPRCPDCKGVLHSNGTSVTARCCKGLGFDDGDVYIVSGRWECQNPQSKLSDGKTVRMGSLFVWSTHAFDLL
jgi:hypothetical protein